MSSSNESQSGLVLTSAPTTTVRVLTLNRPDKRNALSQALIQELLQALSKASADSDVRAIVITGGPSFFSGTPPHLKNEPARNLFCFCLSRSCACPNVGVAI